MFSVDAKSKSFLLAVQLPKGYKAFGFLNRKVNNQDFIQVFLGSGIENIEVTVIWGNFGQVGLLRTLIHFVISRHRQEFLSRVNIQIYSYSMDYGDRKYKNLISTETETNQESTKLKCVRS